MSPYQNHATMHGHIAKWQTSDLTQSAYCKEYGIKPHICKRLFFPRRQAKQLDLEAQLFLSNSRAEIDPMPRVRSAYQVLESQ
jgi:hypothetical protein